VAPKRKNKPGMSTRGGFGGRGGSNPMSMMMTLYKGMMRGMYRGGRGGARGGAPFRGRGRGGPSDSSAGGVAPEKWATINGPLSVKLKFDCHLQTKTMKRSIRVKTKVKSESTQIQSLFFSFLLTLLLMKAIDFKPLIIHLKAFRNLNHSRKIIMVRNAES